MLLTYLLFVGPRASRPRMLARDSFSTLLAIGLTRDVRAPGVRDRRRRHARDPAHRRDAAVHLLRRLVDHRQLRAAWRCCCSSPIGAEAGMNSPIARLFGRDRAAVRAARRLHLALDGVRGLIAQQQPAERPHAARRAARSSAGGSWPTTAPCWPSRCRRPATPGVAPIRPGRCSPSAVGYSIAAKGEAAGPRAVPRSGAARACRPGSARSSASSARGRSATTCTRRSIPRRSSVAQQALAGGRDRWSRSTRDRRRSRSCTRTRPTTTTIPTPAGPERLHVQPLDPGPATRPARRSRSSPPPPAIDSGKYTPNSLVNGNSPIIVSGVPLVERRRPELGRHRPHHRADVFGQHDLRAGRRARRARRR